MNRHQNTSKATSLYWILIAYIACLAAACTYLYIAVPKGFGTSNLLIDTFIADTIATVVIFIFSRALGNSSFYDAYWSVIPPLILMYWHQQLDQDTDITRYILISIVVWYWAIRLTWNWTKHWEGLKHEDWRYALLKEKAPKLEVLTDFFGIHFFPTVQVFLGLLPIYACFYYAENSTNVLDYIALTVGVGAVTIQLISDRQLHNFIVNRKPGQIIHHGLWRYSRHPNYFGELSFWLSLSLFGLAASPGQIAWIFLGTIAMLLMFLFASIPMMEERSLERRPEYQRIIDSTSMLVPWLPKKR